MKNPSDMSHEELVAIVAGMQCKAAAEKKLVTVLLIQDLERVVSTRPSFAIDETATLCLLRAALEVVRHKVHDSRISADAACDVAIAHAREITAWADELRQLLASPDDGERTGG